MNHEARQQPAPRETPHAQPAAAEQPAADSSGRDPGGGGSGSTRRFWSTRRTPAAVVAVIATVIAIALLYEAVAASVGRPPSRWWRGTTDELATRPLEDPWVVVGAALTALLGLWLLLLAVTPGLRRLLPMRCDISDGVRMRAGLKRSAARLIVRDRLQEVPGVESVRVRVGRRRVKAKTRAHFRPLDEVRGDVDRALHDAVGRLGLARRTRVSARVRRPKKQ